MSLDPRNHDWDKELETGLPDCRVKPIERERFRYHVGRIVLDQVFCAQCFKPFGGVPPNCAHVFYICQDCVITKGPPSEIIQVVPGTENM